VSDNFFDPTPLRIARGETLVFDYVGADQHTATDGTGMGLFDSGPVDGGGTSTWFTFSSAGRYAFVCTIHAEMDGQLRIPVRVQPDSGGRHRDYTVRVASDPASGGAVHDLQVRRPGAKRWRIVERAFTDATVSFRPNAGVGMYRFRARLRIPGTDASNWSPVARLRIS
jgi:hypothetical protein